MTAREPRATITEADDGRALELHAGETVALRLHENATSGYRWAFEELDAERVAIVEETFLGRREAVGSGGDVRWVLEAKAPGEASIRLVLRRRWERDAAPAQRFSFTLRVR